ncbi:septum site-determining protein MinC [Azospirillum sp. TSH100]|uniref:septum site-determining protein MinC n=1 Tax=Azospirillum sp. TSH100 TaxID=652764 RepID=UPI000D61272E|nr:septum site-determining protein MinC [Azospirillum sp. TSH100]PWC84469.1 septum site-determining protein MinC [Azospirillum sp. TSH100]QCG87619.1 septum site-determining protein MinC [Azospirillum sp. TSH100]
MSSASQVAERDVPFQLRGNSFTMMVLKVFAPTSPDFFTQLSVKVRQAPNFFRNAPVVLDFDDLPESIVFDLAAFVAQVQALHLLPVGFQGGPQPVREAAAAVGLTPMPSGRAAKLEEVVKAPDPRQQDQQTPIPAPQVLIEVVHRPAVVVTEPVRSGMRVYAEKTDLIVTSSVSPGAELLADGNIHVYGALRGRALAGFSGDANARIFCHSLEAEVLSVAGNYRVSEDIGSDFYKKAVQVFLRDGVLSMDLLKTA